MECPGCPASGLSDLGAHILAVHSDVRLDVWVCPCGFSADSFDAIVHHCIELDHDALGVSRKLDQHLLETAAVFQQRLESGTRSIDVRRRLPTPEPPRSATPPQPKNKPEKVPRRRKAEKRPEPEGIAILDNKFTRKPKTILDEQAVPKELDAMSTAHWPSEQQLAKILVKGPGKLACPVCGAVYKTISGVNSHLYQRHGIKKGRVNFCQVCDLWLDKKDNLHAHIRELHPELARKPHLVCGICRGNPDSLRQLVEHVEKAHGHPARMSKLSFPSAEDFDRWVKTSGVTKLLKKRSGQQSTTVGSLTTYFACKYNPIKKQSDKAREKERLRREEAGEQQQLDFTCTAHMNVAQRPTGAFDVTICADHYGH